MKVLIPKGDDKAPCIAAYQESTGNEVPEFTDRRLQRVSKGITYVCFKGTDIPGLVGGGYADEGVIGSDSMMEYQLRSGSNPDAIRLRNERIGEEMCRFSILAIVADRKRVEDYLDARNGASTLTTVTSKPELLGALCAAQDLPVVDSGVRLSGSVEAALALVGADVAADLVQTGATAEENGLVEVRRLMSVYPTLVRGMN